MAVHWRDIEIGSIPPPRRSDLLVILALTIDTVIVVAAASPVGRGALAVPRLCFGPLSDVLNHLGVGLGKRLPDEARHQKVTPQLYVLMEQKEERHGVSASIFPFPLTWVDQLN